ncbi:hypothetical protein [Carnobacterium sp. ISL-102]|uniref:hypothetical protein n=1 Tax=Carnobacterium sp. ISL-102 TaxID=2819142 RepID=UPI001BEC9B39|nr:hypothetical protein [Carnobacterium sp. ISL-102]MBT2732080.1 hypothetical protein [Carnobacterium sp. ISL-102]
MTKFKLLAIVGLSGVFLVACGVDNSEEAAQKTSIATLVETTSSVETDPNLVIDGPLLKVGQYINDESYGKLQLEKIASPGNQVEVATGVFVTVSEIKIINFTNIPEIAQEDASISYGFEGNQGYDLQVVYSIENKNDFEVSNTIIDKIVLSDGEQISKESYTEDEEFYLEAGSKASDQLSHFSIPHANVDSIKFYFEIANAESYAPLESEPIEVSFK